jgi:hypothetical protein
MRIAFKPPTNLGTVSAAIAWAQDQFDYLQRYLNTGADDVILKPLGREPERIREGMTVLANGTDWDPGSGQGIYSYYAGAWHKLG